MLTSLHRALLVGMVSAVVALGTGRKASAWVEPEGPPLRIVVMDPLCNQLACKCVAGYAQRDYQRLVEFLEKRLGRPVEAAYAEALSLPQARAREGIDLVIGKFSEVMADAAEAGLPVRTIAMLSAKDGTITQTGLFVVRRKDPARSIADLKGRRILFGPASAQEKHAAGLAVLEPLAVPAPAKILLSPSCNSAAMAVVEKEADGAVVSSYAMPLLEGCGTIDKGALRIVGRTAPVPFIGVFATDRVDSQLEHRLSSALLAVRTDPALLTALESREGFVALPPIAGSRAPAGWTDWRGPRRDGICNGVPEKLPAEKRLLWSRTLTGPAMSGLAVAAGYVVVADKGLRDDTDIFRCLYADTGAERWKLVYPAAGKMDFTNSPRANPLICEDLAVVKK
jgi:ABC-type phosphate/phosphonate transport system substrate-binding protein